jgi:pimeloyl-ACP methyl ester carboxylesterase
MPVNAFAQQGLTAAGWRVVQVWDEYLDPDEDASEWVHERLAAAVRHAPKARQILVVGKSMGTLAAADAAEHGWPGIWLTPLLADDESVVTLRRRTAPALLIGGTEDPMWKGRIAREITDDVLELEGADHGLAKAEHLQRIVDAVAAFAAHVI